MQLWVSAQSLVRSHQFLICFALAMYLKIWILLWTEECTFLDCWSFFILFKLKPGSWVIRRRLEIIFLCISEELWMMEICPEIKSAIVFMLVELWFCRICKLHLYHTAWDSIQSLLRISPYQSLFFFFFNQSPLVFLSSYLGIIVMRTSLTVLCLLFICVKLCSSFETVIYFSIECTIFSVFQFYMTCIRNTALNCELSVHWNMNSCCDPVQIKLLQDIRIFMSFSFLVM